MKVIYEVKVDGTLEHSGEIMLSDTIIYNSNGAVKDAEIVFDNFTKHFSRNKTVQKAIDDALFEALISCGNVTIQIRRTSD